MRNVSVFVISLMMGMGAIGAYRMALVAEMRAAIISHLNNPPLIVFRHEIYPGDWTVTGSSLVAR